MNKNNPIAKKQIKYLFIVSSFTHNELFGTRKNSFPHVWVKITEAPKGKSESPWSLHMAIFG
jgi:hypothetical protein